MQIKGIKILWKWCNSSLLSFNLSKLRPAAASGRKTCLEFIVCKYSFCERMVVDTLCRGGKGVGWLENQPVLGENPCHILSTAVPVHMTHGPYLIVTRLPRASLLSSIRKDDHPWLQRLLGEWKKRTPSTAGAHSSVSGTWSSLHWKNTSGLLWPLRMTGLFVCI